MDPPKESPQERRVSESAPDTQPAADCAEDAESSEPPRGQRQLLVAAESSAYAENSAAPSVASDEGDTSDVCSSIADSEIAADSAGAAAKGAGKRRKRARQPAIMIGYKKRRKAQYAVKRCEDEETEVTANEDGHAAAPSDDEKSRQSLERSSSEENLLEGSVAVKYSSVSSEVTETDKFCWICHKEGGSMLKCIACPRVYHSRCHFQGGLPEGPGYDPSTFHCPECTAVLKADNLNTRSSAVSASVNQEQLSTLLNHVVCILKSQKDSHYFWGPVDTKEFPHYREYVIYPMDISMLEKNIKNNVYGCTNAFVADVKWIVHNSIVFNSSAAKITNVAKNLLKICKREIIEIETCAECYYNSLVRKDTWFIEVCKKPHLLVWARLKGYPPWPAKALKCRDGMVDCRFFGAHDKAWVPLKDCFLYSKVAPQPVKLKKGSHLESGIQELEKHIKKLKDKFGIFVYPTARIPYRPSQEAEQLRIMLPNFNPNILSRLTKFKPSDRICNIQPKPAALDDDEEKAVAEEEEPPPPNEPPEDGEEATDAEGTRSTSDDSPPPGDTAVKDGGAVESCSDAERSTAVTGDATPPPPETAKAETPASPTPADAAASPRKLVSVKNIESINASVSPGACVIDPPEVTSAPTSGAESEEAPAPAISKLAAAVVRLQTQIADAAQPLAQVVGVAPPLAQVVVAAPPSAQAVVAAPPSAQAVVAAPPSAQAVVAAPSSAQAAVAAPASAQVVGAAPALAQVVGGKTTLAQGVTAKPLLAQLASATLPLAQVTGTTLPLAQVASPTPPLAQVASATPALAQVASATLSLAQVASTTITLAPIASATSPPAQVDATPPLAQVPVATLPLAQDSVATPPDTGFDLTKVKDEPIDCPEPVVKEVAVTKKLEILANQPVPPAIPTFVAKRPFDLAADTKPVKKVKPNAKCRTVNITENVTLSLINQSPTDPPRPRASVAMKPKRPVSLPVPPIIPVTAAALVSASGMPAANRLVCGFSAPSDISMLRAKVTTTPTLVSVSNSVSISRPNTKIHPRVVNHVSQTNGVLSVSTKPAVTVTPSRSSPKFNESYNDFFNKAMNECLAECHSQFRRIFESTLDKLIQKGDLRARIVALKKEMDMVKRNHELIIDEMRRDYEIQLAELRTTSMAKSQLDVAAERLRMEQEKERAVKEAKSKQWCSNCQKIANYYCCWNTAYCDFECQKEHWVQHMHMCKNDVKKKAAESSENEPPRIMMQSENSNGYPMNGYDRSGSSFSYSTVGTSIGSSHPASRNVNFNRPRSKVPLVRTTRPLLPRVTCTVTSTPASSSPVTNGVVVQNAFPNSRPPAYPIGNNAATVYTPVYQK